jgi:hypothetical protein
VLWSMYRDARWESFRAGVLPSKVPPVLSEDLNQEVPINSN